VIQKEAMEEDHRLSLVDAAKKRAIRTVGSYEEFQHRVAYAHLRPLSRKDIQNVAQDTRGFSNAIARKNVGGHYDGGCFDAVLREGGKLGKAMLSEPKLVNCERTKANYLREISSRTYPTTCSTKMSALGFEKAWQTFIDTQASPQEKQRFYQEVGGSTFIERCFVAPAKEMSAETLGDIIETLAEAITMEEGGKREDSAENGLAPAFRGDLVRLLYILPGMGRFSVTFALLTPTQATTARKLVRQSVREEGQDKEEGRQGLMEVWSPYIA